MEKIEKTENNGGKTDYYQLDSCPFQIHDFDDFAEWRNLNGFQFNIGKVVWTFNIGRHNGTDYIRDLNKIIHYAQRELKRVKRQQEMNIDSEKSELPNILELDFMSTEFDVPDTPIWDNTEWLKDLKLAITEGYKYIYSKKNNCLYEIVNEFQVKSIPFS